MLGELIASVRSVYVLIAYAGDYCKAPVVDAQQPPRLFVLNDAVTGGKGVGGEEILHFAQSDLLSEDVALLDSGNAVFVWIGKGASENEQKEAPKIAEQYLAASNRSSDTPVTTVRILPALSNPW
jgi:hypothetical protein